MPILARRSRRGFPTAAPHMLLLLVAALVLLPRPAAAQLLRQMGNAAKSAALTAADAAAEASLAKATPVNLTGWKLPVVPLALGVGIGVSQVDLADSVGLRVHAWIENALDAPAVVRIPPDSAFTLTDATGRQLAAMSRVRVNGKTGQRELTVPAATRVPVRLLFRAAAPGVVRAVLRVGPNATLGEIPVRLEGVADGAGGRAAPEGAPAGDARVALGDLALAPPAGWQRADQKGVPIFLDPTSTTKVVSFIAVHPPVPVRGTLRDFVRGEFFSANERLLGDFQESATGDSRDAGVWTSEKRADGMEVFRRYRAVQVGDRAALLIGTTNDFGRDRAMLDRMYEVAASVTIGGRGPGARVEPRPASPAPAPVPAPTPVKPTPVKPTPAKPTPVKPAPVKPAPSPAPAPAPAPPPTRAAAGGKPNFVGTYFSWGMINTKLLILANGTWETAQSKGKWTYGGGRMVVLDGNARGWCGGRGILNDDETQLNFDCVSKDGFPMNTSFAKHSKEIER